MPNTGKEFENDFKKSVEEYPEIWIYRPTDFGGGQAARFTNHSLCDYILFNNITQALFLLELKTIQGKSISCPSIELLSSINEIESQITATKDTEHKKELKKVLKELLHKGNSYKIKQHQIKGLLEVENNDVYLHIHPYVIINFRDSNETFVCKPSQLLKILSATGKSSLNTEDLKQYNCKILEQNHIRNTKRWKYEVKEMLYKW